MKINLAVLMLFMLAACSPRIKYLGDDYPYKAQLDVFYDEQDVERPYAVMGHMTAEMNEFLHQLDEVREAMIQQAKERGADGIIFLGFYEAPQFEGDDNRDIVEAKLIRYKD